MSEEKKERCVTNIMSRVTGFYSNFHAFNPGKQEEFLERKKFDTSVKSLQDEELYPEIEKDAFR